MRRLIAFLILAASLAICASAAYVPDSETCENRDGRQLVIRTYTLPPGDDPRPLAGGQFTRDGYSYTFLSIVKEAKRFESKKTRSETVTVETETDDLAAILCALKAAIPYDDGEYIGTLTLDHTSLRTEATGYSTKRYTVSETKTYENLDRNDPSLIPRTTEKNGVTLALQGIEWHVQDMAAMGDDLTAALYTATAKYSASASYKAADGYATTATYTGETVSSGIASITYTVTYVGEPIPSQEPEQKRGHIPEPETVPEMESEPDTGPESETEQKPKPKPTSEKTTATPYAISAVIALLLLAGAAAAYMFLRKNTRIYAIETDGDGFELVGRQRLGTYCMTIDLPACTKYPRDIALVEIDGTAARKLSGKMVSVKLREGYAYQRIGPSDSGSYCFKIKT